MKRALILLVTAIVAMAATVSIQFATNLLP
jgi:hypothetical protein